MDRKSNHAESIITNMFLFNSTWSSSESEEEKKVIYFWPEDTDIDQKLQKVGLVEGIIAFANKFSSKPAYSINTLKERIVFIQADDNFWLCITVTIPNSRKVTKDSGEVIEFYPQDVNDSVLLSLLHQSYDMFCLFHCSLQAALNRVNGKKEIFLELVQHFFSRYQATISVGNGDIRTVWSGIQYLALQSADFLAVQSLICRIKSQQKLLRKCLFLQSGQLVWSEVEPGQTKLIVQYLSTTILPILSTSSREPSGAFLVGGEENLPTMYIGETPLRLAVFHAINTTLCLLFESVPSKSFFTSFCEYDGKAVGNLSADLTHIYCSKTTSAPLSDSVSFLYFNSSNLAVKSTIEDNKDKVLKIAADFIEDLRKAGRNEGEIVAKMWSEDWVVVQVAGTRTIVVILHERNHNLMEVAEAVAKLQRTNFDSICML